MLETKVIKSWYDVKIKLANAIDKAPQFIMIFRQRALVAKAWAYCTKKTTILEQSINIAKIAYGLAGFAWPFIAVLLRRLHQ